MDPLYVTEEFAQWIEKENRRVSHEWSAWDGSAESAERIVDVQCVRMTSARARMENGGLATQ